MSDKPKWYNRAPFADGWTGPHDMDCGVRGAIFADDETLAKTPIFGLGSAERHARSCAAGWYSDCFGQETYNGKVYSLESDDDESDDDAPAAFYAVVTHSDWSEVTVDPEPCDCESDAAHRADDMARMIAEHEREYEFVFQAAGRCRIDLHEANELRRRALKHEWANRGLTALGLGGVIASKTLHCETARELWTHAEGARDKVFSDIRAARPYASDARLSDAWREGWSAI